MLSLLKNNIVDCIKEQQLKLGYLKAPTRLYYMLDSLNLMNHTNYSWEEMLEKLKEFGKDNKIGQINVSVKDNRFCLFLSEEWSQYVYENIKDSDFVLELINMSIENNKTIKDVIEIFKKYNDKIHIEKMIDEEFDYLIYFKDAIPDNYRYCFHLEGDKIIYHRYTPWDYESFGFNHGKVIENIYNL